MGTIKMVINKIVKDLRAVLSDPDRKSILQILLEFFYCSLAKRCLAVHYFTNFLYRKETKNILDYLTEKEAKSIQHIINHPSLSDIASSKLTFIEHFARGGFPVPKLLAYNLISKLYLNYDGKWEAVELNSDKHLRYYLENLMNYWNIDEIFIKLIRGSGGIGARKISRSILNNQTQIEDLLISLNKDSYVFQEVIKQHPDIARFNPDTLNTVRIDTFRAPDLEPKILSAMFRIGGSGKCVDNVSSGGVFVGVNLDTGMLKSSGYNFFHASDVVQSVRKSPVTGIDFDGFTLPYFQELINTVIRAAAYLPTALAGWDVAISPRGPILIEANILYYGILPLNMAYGGYRNHPVWQEAVKYAREKANTQRQK
jgi:hypothetical protein